MTWPIRFAFALSRPSWPRERRRQPVHAPLAPDPGHLECLGLRRHLAGWYRGAGPPQLHVDVREADQHRIVRRADEGRAVLVGDVGEEPAERERGGDVDARGRLVGDDHRRPRGERPRDGDALALAGGEQVGEAVGVLGEPDGDEGVDRALVRVDPVDAADREPQLDVLARGEEAREPGRLADERDRVAAEAGPGIAIERRTSTGRRSAPRPHPAGRARETSESSVDLPEPDGPVTTESRPGANVAVRSSSAMSCP